MSTNNLGNHNSTVPRTKIGGKWAVVLFVLGSLPLQSTASHAQEAIGSATSVKPQAEANTRMLSGGSTVYSKELIHTGDAGVADLRFHDTSNPTVVQNRASVSISSSTTRINLPVALR